MSTEENKITNTFSGIYDPMLDTVQQRRMYLKLASHAGGKTDIDAEYIKLYNTIFRFDLLLWGKVVLTDAMWFDSKWLYKMENRGAEFEDGFKKFLDECSQNGVTPIEIRTREDYPGMFHKPFYFSSLDNEDVKKNLMDFGGELKKKKEHDMGEYLEQLESNTFSNDPEVQFLKKYLEAANNILVEKKGCSQQLWENLNPNLFNHLSNSFKEKMDNLYGKKIVDEDLRELKRAIKKYNRSDVEIIMIRIMQSKPLLYRKDFDEYIFRKYNMAIANSQNLYYLDNYRKAQEAAFGDNTAPFYKFVETIGQMTWEEFCNQYLDTEMIRYRDELWKKVINGVDSNKEYCDLFCKVAPLENLFQDKIYFWKHDGQEQLWFPEKSTVLPETKSSISYNECSLFIGNPNANVYTLLKDKKMDEETKRHILALCTNPFSTAESQFSGDKMYFYPEHIWRAVHTANNTMLGRPIVYELSLSGECNCKCGYCCCKHLNSAHKVNLGKKYIDFIADQIVKNGGQAVTLTGGGEPMMNPNFPYALKTLHDKGLSVGIITNGMRLKENWIPDIIQYAKFIRISLDTVDKTSYKKIRGLSLRKGKLDIFCKLAEQKKKSNSDIRIGAQIVLTEQSDEELFLTIQEVREWGFDFIQIRPQDNIVTEPITVDLYTNYEGRRVTLERASRLFTTRDFSVLINRKFDEIKEDIESKPNYKRYNMCRGAHFTAAIGQDMHVYFCCAHIGNSEYDLGRLDVKDEESLKKILLSNRRRKLIKLPTFNGCQLQCRNHSMNIKLENLRTKTDAEIEAEIEKQSAGDKPVHCEFL